MDADILVKQQKLFHDQFYKQIKESLLNSASEHEQLLSDELDVLQDKIIDTNINVEVESNLTVNSDGFDCVDVSTQIELHPPGMFFKSLKAITNNYCTNYKTLLNKMSNDIRERCDETFSALKNLMEHRPYQKDELLSTLEAIKHKVYSIAEQREARITENLDTFNHIISTKTIEVQNIANTNLFDFHVVCDKVIKYGNSQQVDALIQFGIKPEELELKLKILKQLNTNQLKQLEGVISDNHDTLLPAFHQLIIDTEESLHYILNFVQNILQTWSF